MSFYKDQIDAEEKTIQLKNFIAFAENASIEQYSDEIIINLPEDRTEFYMDTNYHNILSTLTHMASIIA
jgi:hypothetical protein